MSDVIKLLPDAVANQIAAGEVIQRPASAVKELLENAIDAGADNIQLIIKDGGKTLIQVVDNGSGMSPTDARLCFERHATSKIQQASDLFSIRTMGFRGEALASMAAIARVELKTRREEEQIGTEVIVEAARMISQNPCNCSKGTSISVKNLFFNTPARRNFLKSDNVEKRHILQEFQRVAIAYPDISFQYHQNNQLTHQFPKAKLKQRISNIFGSNYNQRVVPVSESTQLIRVEGFVGKPEFAKKARGEQYLFVNQRFIRSAYLNHAVDQAFAEMIPEDAFPTYFLFLETEPDQIDVNVHPTKTEIKFQDERYVYQIIKTAVKRALGSFNISPSLDFEQEKAFDFPLPDKNRPINPPGITVNPEYNPFDRDTGSVPRSGQDLRRNVNPGQWEKLFPSEKDIPLPHGTNDQKQYTISPDWDQKRQDNGQKFFQLHNRYIITPVKSGMMAIDQHRAHERVLYEKYHICLTRKSASSQQLLFPENIKLNENDAAILREISGTIKELGFGIHELTKNTFVVEAVPADLSEDQSVQSVIEGIIENMEKNISELKKDLHQQVLRSMAKRIAIKHGKALTVEEMTALANSLFACDTPQYTPDGKPVLQIMTLDELSQRFK